MARRRSNSQWYVRADTAKDVRMCVELFRGAGLRPIRKATLCVQVLGVKDKLGRAKPGERT